MQSTLQICCKRRSVSQALQDRIEKAGISHICKTSPDSLHRGAEQRLGTLEGEVGEHGEGRIGADTGGRGVDGEGINGRRQGGGRRRRRGVIEGRVEGDAARKDGGKGSGREAISLLLHTHHSQA